MNTRVFHLMILLFLFVFLFGAGNGCVMKEFIYAPDKEIVRTPADVGLVFEDLSLHTSDGVEINGWFIPYPGTRTTLLWFHGNGGNISYTVDRLRKYHHALKANLLVIDYREYGRSRGEASEEGTYLDALAAYDYLLSRKDVDPTRIIAFGYSLGSAIAVELSLQRKTRGLILEAPFASIEEMAEVRFPWIPVGPLITTRYDTLSKISR
ncbi:MAG TPA: alpha/beta fold hydrolase, partial [Candidatus Manganitrophaceae bacterium]|nr:alpha/beta fold hydrolase [Candidatus Manganitrophaceae bacterium]